MSEELTENSHLARNDGAARTPLTHNFITQEDLNDLGKRPQGPRDLAWLEKQSQILTKMMTRLRSDLIVKDENNTSNIAESQRRLTSTGKLIL